MKRSCPAPLGALGPEDFHLPLWARNPRGKLRGACQQNSEHSGAFRGILQPRLRSSKRCARGHTAPTAHSGSAQAVPAPLQGCVGHGTTPTPGLSSSESHSCGACWAVLSDASAAGPRLWQPVPTEGAVDPPP